MPAGQRSANDGEGEEGWDQEGYDPDYAFYLSQHMGFEDSVSGAATSSQDQPAVATNSQGQRETPEGGNQHNLKRSQVIDPIPMDVDNTESDDEGDWSRGEIDGLFCPICMEGWTTGGDHQVCCIPCGHIYGMSCIKKWLHQLGNRGKCPQCNRKCKLKDIRPLYASRIVAVDQELQKQLRSLESKCASLEEKDADWSRKEKEWKKREHDLHVQVKDLTERTTYLEKSLNDARSSLQEQLNYGNHLRNNLLDEVYYKFFFIDRVNQGSPPGFIILKELQMQGARLFDFDIHNQSLLLARRLSGMGGAYMLTKISLLTPHERENIQLPVNVKVVKDLRVSPHDRLALLASLGKKLSVISTESNNTVLTYDLPTAAWSCAWDVNNSQYLYAGLQDGMVLEFDLRQTSRPVDSMVGLTDNPVHTIYSLSADSALSSGRRSVLTASSAGLCHWNFGSSEERSFLIPESLNQGVCISLAYGPKSGDIVASFRPKVQMEGPTGLSQPLSTQSSSLLGQAVQGLHAHYRSVGGTNSITRYQKLGSTCANVDRIRLPQSAVIDRGDKNSYFAAGDEATGDLVLQELPTLEFAQRIKSSKPPIRDVKYSRILDSELLSCLCEDTLQLFRCKLP
ncbi:OLC1v1034481C1 [Oldenlandia corymbosa var. corymbosa]|uniref:RING-type E3 ubiquitin transferase n=1 Tax=Oldenlandia corymbosa var. corymbosa TaxID=529605 RepID=A0AAV1CQM8_OLDCO|nr:OLC1v1034481C1 [Oldenlandia corymbosa var. corymbosa]